MIISKPAEIQVYLQQVKIRGGGDIFSLNMNVEAHMHRDLTEKVIKSIIWHQKASAFSSRFSYFIEVVKRG